MLFVFQIMMICYAATAAWMQYTILKTFIDYVPIGAKSEKYFHTAGAIMTVIVAVIISFAAKGLVASMLMLSVCLLWYWFVFDCVLGKLLHKDWFFIGSTAIMDKILRKLFDEMAGEIKACIALVAILILNFYIL